MQLAAYGGLVAAMSSPIHLADAPCRTQQPGESPQGMTSGWADTAVGRTLQRCNYTRPFQPAFCTAGGFQVSSRIDGGLSFGQYMRSIGMNSPLGAGSQLASLFLPGDSFWK